MISNHAYWFCNGSRARRAPSRGEDAAVLAAVKVRSSPCSPCSPAAARGCARLWCSPDLRCGAAAPHERGRWGRGSASGGGFRGSGWWWVAGRLRSGPCRMRVLGWPLSGQLAQERWTGADRGKHPPYSELVKPPPEAPIAHRPRSTGAGAHSGAQGVARSRAQPRAGAAEHGEHGEDDPL